MSKQIDLEEAIAAKDYDAADNARKSYDLAIKTMREELLAKRAKEEAEQLDIFKKQENDSGL